MGLQWLPEQYRSDPPGERPPLRLVLELGGKTHQSYNPGFRKPGSIPNQEAEHIDGESGGDRTWESK